jgi:hypothetical protein
MSEQLGKSQRKREWTETAIGFSTESRKIPEAAHQSMAEAQSVSKGRNVTKGGTAPKMLVISCQCHISIVNEMSETQL